MKTRFNLTFSVKWHLIGCVFASGCAAILVFVECYMIAAMSYLTPSTSEAVSGGSYSVEIWDIAAPLFLLVFCGSVLSFTVAVSIVRAKKRQSRWLDVRSRLLAIGAVPVSAVPTFMIANGLSLGAAALYLGISILPTVLMVYAYGWVSGLLPTKTTITPNALHALAEDKIARNQNHPLNTSNNAQEPKQP